MQNMNKKQRSALYMSRTPVSVRLFFLSLDLQSFRAALHILQQQVDDLDELKARHYQEIMEHEEEVWDVVQGKVCLNC